jgi:lipopolysaccharide transport system permease protein
VIRVSPSYTVAAFTIVRSRRAAAAFRAILPDKHMPAATAARPQFACAIVHGMRDLREGAAASELWAFMGWQDVRQRYRRTVLGPWWLAISTALLVVSLGFLWSEIFHVGVRTFLPYFGIGYVLWTFLSGAANEACTGFTQFDGIIKQRRVPLSAFLYRIAVRHAIALAHNAVVIVLLMLWAGTAWSDALLLAIPGLAMFGVTVTLATIPIAILCTRFRDFPQIVGNALQIAFFATPIMWRPDVLANFRWVVEYNPFAYLIDIVRQPLLGITPGWASWLWSGAMLAVAATASAYLLGRYGRRVAYWL